MPKLQTACSTVCTEGMVVDTRSPEVVAARASVFEFLLLNHPLDCPVCDKGGECPLQDYSNAFGPAQSRMDFPRRVFDGEGVKGDVDFGPTLMLNRNRCILCTRCVRFMRDVDGDAQISIQDRGNGSQIETFQEEGVHSLLSGNLMDVCPVGAITTKDYRFKSRPWDNPTAVDTICTLLLEGLQHHGLAARQAGVGQGSAHRPPHAAVQPRRERVLDVRHRPVRLPLRRGRQPAAAPARARRGGELAPAAWHDLMVQLRDALGPTADDLRGPPALPGLGARLARGAGPARPTGARPPRRGRRARISRSAGRVSRKAQPAGTKFVVPALDAPNVERRPRPRPARGGGRGRRRGSHRAARGGGRGRGAGGLRARPRSRRVARRHRVARRGPPGRPRQGPRRAGNPPHRSREGRGLRAARRQLPREGRLLHQRQAPRAGHRREP